MDTSPHLQTQTLHRFPQSKYIDSLKWLTPLSAFTKYIILALHDTDSDTSILHIKTLNTSSKTPFLQPHSHWSPPSRISSLKTSQTPHNPVVAASTYSGSLHFITLHPINLTVDTEVSVGGEGENEGLHVGGISGFDLFGSGSECVSVGEDGRVNVVSLGEGEARYKRVWDSNGLVSYSAVKWGSPSEFATGGFGESMQWWDLRKPGGVVAQFKGSSWAHGNNSGIVHSIDIHPSRKHVCVAGGSSGAVFAWDLRKQQEKILLSGGRQGGATPNSLSESEIWEVQYDCYTPSSNIGNNSSLQILPVMTCSEDGILSIVEKDVEPEQILAEPCAINSFDINLQNPSEVICSLEWESVAYLLRQ